MAANEHLGDIRLRRGEISATNKRFVILHFFFSSDDEEKCHLNDYFSFLLHRRRETQNDILIESLG